MSLIEVDIPSQSTSGYDGVLPSEPSNTLPSFEEIFAMTTVDQLRPVTRTVLEIRFTPEEVEEAMIPFELMADLHRGRERRSGAEEGTHPAFVGLWHVLTNPDATVDEYGAAVLHDTGEDCGQNEQSIRTHLTERGYPEHRAQRVARVVEALTRTDSDDQASYIDKMIRMSREPEIADIRVIPIKALDTAHTVLSYSEEVQSGKVTPEKARDYLYRKGNQVDDMAQTYARDAKNTETLKDTINGLDRQLKRIGQREQPARRRALPTARVPALSPTH